MELLERLDADHWSAPIACAGWSVKDFAAHSLTGTYVACRFAEAVTAYPFLAEISDIG